MRKFGCSSAAATVKMLNITMRPMNPVLSQNPKVFVRGQFDSVKSVVIHSALPDSMEAPDVDERKSGAA